jgi:hypothetical protein
MEGRRQLMPEGSQSKYKGSFHNGQENQVRVFTIYELGCTRTNFLRSTLKKEKFMESNNLR